MGELRRVLIRLGRSPRVASSGPLASLHSLAAMSSAPHTRWLAYESVAGGDADNVELEPGNTKDRSCTWSADFITAEPHDFRGFATTADTTTNCAATAFNESRVPQRTLTWSSPHASVASLPHAVYFLPHSFLPTHSCDKREAEIASLAEQFTAADTLTSDAYTRFRFVWLLARDGSALQPPEELARIAAHTTLYAPITTHDQKAFMRSVMRKLMPVDHEATSASAASSVNGEPSPLPVAAVDQFHAALRRNDAGLLPEVPFACDINDPDAMLRELFQVMVHAHVCRTMGWNLDSRTWQLEDASFSHTFERAWSTGCASVLAWLRGHIAQREVYLEFVARCYRELLPASVLLRVLDSCLPLDWMDLTFQQGLVRRVMRDPIAIKYPPSVEHRYDVWRTLCEAIERHVCLAVHDELLVHLQEINKERLQADRSKPLMSHWTVTYRDAATLTPSEVSSLDPSSSRTCTLGLESGFSSTTGCSLWPAGMLMCDFIIANRHLFAGKRVLELGVGIGLTTIMIHRAGVATLVCTDCDEKALRNLHVNFSINDVPVVEESDSDTALFGPGVHIANLDWCSPDRSTLLRRAAPDIIIACDTIYLPELHDAQGTVVREGLRFAQALSAGASGASEPCAYFAQMRRNPETFTHYIDTFAGLGLKGESILPTVTDLPSRFGYDRDAIQFHRFTLQNEPDKS